MIRRLSTAAVCALVLTLCACSSARSAVPQGAAAFSQANQAYLQGHYADAVRGYRALLARQGYSPAVLFNLGNAWMRLNQPGRAILNYERALWLAPADRAVAANLQTAQRQSGLAVTQPTLLDRSLGLLSFDALAWSGTAAALALSLAVLIARSRRSIRGSVPRAVAAASTLVLIAASAILVWRWPDLERAVAIADATPVHIAPAGAADASFQLKAGELVQLGRRYGEYVLVHTGDGRTGWVSAQQVPRIVTRTRDYEAQHDVLAGSPAGST